MQEELSRCLLSWEYPRHGRWNSRNLALCWNPTRVFESEQPHISLKFGVVCIISPWKPAFTLILSITSYRLYIQCSKLTYRLNNFIHSSAFEEQENWYVDSRRHILTGYKMSHRNWSINHPNLPSTHPHISLTVIVFQKVSFSYAELRAAESPYITSSWIDVSDSHHHEYLTWK